MKTVDHMLILDVDGVISSLKEKKARPEILEYVAEKLRNGKPVAFNTGRSLDWVVTRAGKTLIDNPGIKKFLKNLIIVGEKGGTWMTFDDEGRPQEHVDESISVSSDLQVDIQNLITTKYSESMFYDSPKKTMSSSEMKDGYDMNKYAQDQKLLIPQVEEIIKRYGLENILEIEPNPIALDVQNRNVGKDLGIKRILNWLKACKIKVLSFTTIGDSPSDIKMAQELKKNNFSVRHVHVGKKGVHNGLYPFEVITTKKEYDEGADEFLKGSAFRS